MNIGLSFEVIYKDSDFLEVRASAWNGAFGGAADVYVGIGVLEETAAKLLGFPRNTSDNREVTLGSFSPDRAGGGVKMRFCCADASGHAFVELRIDTGSTSGKQLESVTMYLPVEAAAVDSFVAQLRRAGSSRSGIARLETKGLRASLSP